MISGPTSSKAQKSTMYATEGQTYNVYFFILKINFKVFPIAENNIDVFKDRTILCNGSLVATCEKT